MLIFLFSECSVLNSSLARTKKELIVLLLFHVASYKILRSYTHKRQKRMLHWLPKCTRQKLFSSESAVLKLGHRPGDNGK